MTASSDNKKGPFSRLFNRQKDKVNTKDNVSNVLRQFADDDLKKIAVVIDEWLKADEGNEKNAPPIQRVRRYKGK